MKVTHRPLTVVAVLLSMFMAAMEATVVATAMPTVVADLGGLELYGWVGAVYMLTSTVTMPLYGKLADLYGRKPVLFLGLTVFLVGSMTSGLSSTMTQLIVFRGVQGVGAGGLQPIALTIIGDLFRPAERARIQGVFGAVWGIAGMAGPLVGGLIVHALSWRWVFFINVPFGVLSAVVLTFVFHETVEKKDHRLDVLGTLLLGSAVVALLLGASRWLPIVMLPLAAVLLAAFVLVELRAREPVLPMELLSRRVILVSSIAGAVVGAVMSSSVIYLPLFVQAVMQGSPTEAGGAVAPMLVGWPIASAVGGRLLSRTGYRPLIRVGFVIVSVSTVLVVLTLRAHSSVLVIGAVMALMGIGMGLANTALLIAVQESVSWQERGVATASAMFFRSIGGAISVGALGALLAASFGPDVPTALLNKVVGPEHGRDLPMATLALLSRELDAGLVRVFQVIAGLSVIAVVASFFFPAGRLGQAEKD